MKDTAFTYLVRFGSYYLRDTCAGGSWGGFSDAKTWATEEELAAELRGAELYGAFEVVRLVSVRPPTSRR